MRSRDTLATVTVRTPKKAPVFVSLEELLSVRLGQG
jgi:hypothetical protein